MQTITDLSTNLRRMLKLCSLLGISNEQRKEIIYNYSEGRTASSKGLTDAEAQEIVEALQRQYNSTPEGKSCDLMRRKVLACFHRLGYERKNGRPDWDRIRVWMMNKSYLKKHLNSYTYQELPKLVSQVESMLK